jgi:hypothetical protein
MRTVDGRFGLGIAEKGKGGSGQRFGGEQVGPYLRGQCTAFSDVDKELWEETTACSDDQTYLSFFSDKHTCKGCNRFTK